MKIRIIHKTAIITVFILLLISCSNNSNETGLANSDDSVPTEQGLKEPTEEATPLPSDTPVPSATPEPTSTPEPLPTPSPTPDIDLAMEIPLGESLRGRNAAVRYRCYGCHVESAGEYAPPFASDDGLPQIMERGELRLADPGYEGRATTNLEYIIESIFFTEAYVIPGDWEEEMPTTFPLRITDEELANIIAWMETVDNE